MNAPLNRRGLLAALLLPLAARAQEPGPIRIGLLASYSGPYADYGRQFDAGIALWLKEHGGRLAGRRVEVVKRDVPGAAPELARRAAQELAVREQVQLLTGLDFSPNAYSVAQVATQAKLPTLVLNAASSGITAASPYVARLSFTVQQVSAPMAQWLARGGLREVHTVVADYAPGADDLEDTAKLRIPGGDTTVIQKLGRDPEKVGLLPWQIMEGYERLMCAFYDFRKEPGNAAVPMKAHTNRAMRFILNARCA